MESGSAASSTREHKNAHNKVKETEDEDEDIFSKLPEPIISHILSFLSTEDAVRTSVLSKRWINRWTFITSLNLDDNCELYNSDGECVLSRKRKTVSEVHFVNFVNRALLLTQGSNMDSVSLVISNKYEASLLNTWISSILIRRVKNLRINMSICYELPFSPLTSHFLFSSQNYLEEMDLDMEYASIKVPTCGFVYFSSLKILKLCGTIFTFDYSLNLNLPNLKKFKTENCFWVSAHGGSVTVDAPLLETIFIEHYMIEDKKMSSYAINFTASQLKKITYWGAGDGLSQPIILPAPSSARDASATIILFEYDHDTGLETESRAFMLLKQFCQVKSLTFEGLEVLTQPNVLPVFPMLCHLELSFVTGEVLLGLLQKSPLLKTLIVNEEISKFDKELLNSCVMPECLTLTLQNVTYKTVNGCEHELDLAKFFLENGTVLERMHFSLVKHKPKVMKEFKKKIFSFKKGFSSSVIIEFSY